MSVKFRILSMLLSAIGFTSCAVDKPKRNESSSSTSSADLTIKLPLRVTSSLTESGKVSQVVFDTQLLRSQLGTAASAGLKLTSEQISVQGNDSDQPTACDNPVTLDVALSTDGAATSNSKPDFCDPVAKIDLNGLRVDSTYSLAVTATNSDGLQSTGELQIPSGTDPIDTNVDMRVSRATTLSTLPTASGSSAGSPGTETISISSGGCSDNAGLRLDGPEVCVPPRPIIDRPDLNAPPGCSILLPDGTYDAACAEAALTTAIFGCVGAALGQVIVRNPIPGVHALRPEDRIAFNTMVDRAKDAAAGAFTDAIRPGGRMDRLPTGFFDSMPSAVSQLYGEMGADRFMANAEVIAHCLLNVPLAWVGSIFVPWANRVIERAEVPEVRAVIDDGIFWASTCGDHNESRCKYNVVTSYRRQTGVPFVGRIQILSVTARAYGYCHRAARAGFSECQTLPVFTTNAEDADNYFRITSNMSRLDTVTVAVDRCPEEIGGAASPMDYHYKCEIIPQPDLDRNHFPGNHCCCNTARDFTGSWEIAEEHACRDAGKFYRPGTCGASDRASRILAMLPVSNPIPDAARGETTRGMSCADWHRAPVFPPPPPTVPLEPCTYADDLRRDVCTLVKPCLNADGFLNLSGSTCGPGSDAYDRVYMPNASCLSRRGEITRLCP